MLHSIRFQEPRRATHRRRWPCTTPGFGLRRARLVARLTVAVLAGALPAHAGGFATSVHEFVPGPGIVAGSGFGITSRILGGPRGEGHDNGSLDVLTLGVGGSVTVAFDGVVFDGPGDDFTVFENGLWFGGGFYGELLFVEVSSDGIAWARFPNHSGTPAPLALFDTYDPALVSGFGGNREVYANVVTNSIDAFDSAVSGGDAFDLALLAGHPLVQTGILDLASVRYVRLVDVLGDGSAFDSDGRPIYDPTGGTASADVDAVAAIHLDAPVAVQKSSWSEIKRLWR